MYESTRRQISCFPSTKGKHQEKIAIDPISQQITPLHNFGICFV